MLNKLRCAMLLALLQATPGLAQPAVPRVVTAPQLTVELIAASSSVANTTGDAWGALRFRLNDGWHIYWTNPGDSGGPPTVTWTLPHGVTAGPFIWPAPSRLPLGPLMNYGYEGDAVLPVRLTVDSAVRQRPLSIRADVRWLVCREVCVSGKGTVALTLPLPAADRTAATEWSERIAAARAAVPKSAPSTWQFSAVSEKEHFVLTITRPERAESAYFFPLVESQVDDSATQAVTANDRTIRLRLRKSEQLTKDPSALRGVLTLASGLSVEIVAPISPSTR